jgi:UDP-2,3-diacylglucosamine pyrophosphatase LpxH
MKKYSFDNIKNIYVIGDCHGEFKTYFRGIKNGLLVKDDDAEKPHPMEAERQARMKAREEAHRVAALRNAMRGHRYGDGGGLRFEMPQDITYTMANDGGFFSKAKKAMKMSSFPHSNSIFIIAGDCGIGFNKPKYYEDLFTKFNKILEYNNTFIIFVRGNHDDPDYFDGEKINFSNIKAVPDYSVLEANGKTILCVGGAISTDRSWRKKQEDRINRFSSSYKKRLYWEGEAPVFNIDALNEITNSIKIDYVVSHSAPSFASPETRGIFEEWAEGDVTLIDDMKSERITLDKVFNTLRDNGSKPSYWAYGHFDMNFLEKRSDTLFRALGDGFNPINIETDIIMFEQNEKLNKLKKKDKKPAIKRLNTEEMNIGRPIEPEPEEMDVNEYFDDPEGAEVEIAHDDNGNTLAADLANMAEQAIGEGTQMNMDELRREINERYQRLAAENRFGRVEAYNPVYNGGWYQVQMPNVATLTNNNAVVTLEGNG